MKVSLITISYNSADTISDTIQSVASQSYSDIEYIVVDGASKDATLKIISDHSAYIHKHISEADKGIYDGMNKGLQLASGDIIGILNSDDVYADKEVIQDIVALFEKDYCDAVYADLVYVDRHDLNKTIRYWKAKAYHEGDFKKGWMPPHPTFFVRRKIYEQYGYFNLDLKSAADYEIMLRFIHKHKIKISYLPRVIVKMRAGGQSNVTLKNRIKANREDKKAWLINGLKPGPFTLIRKPLSKLFQFIKKGR